MSNVNMFEVAIKSKFRFPFKGLISTEDLYDLSVQELDSVFKKLNSQLKQTSEESLLDTKTSEDKEVELKVEIVKHIVNEKLEALNKKLKEKEIAEQKQKLAQILAMKQDEELQNKSVEELQQMLNELK